MKRRPFVLRKTLQKDSHKQILLCGAPFSSQVSLLSFFPKELLNRSRNPIPVWRKSQIFRLQLTDDFGPFKLTFQPNLNHLDWISKPKVMPKILTDVQAEILIRIGLGFGANFLWFLAPIGLEFNWVGILLNSCLAGCKLTWFNWPSPALHVKHL